MTSREPNPPYITMIGPSSGTNTKKKSNALAIKIKGSSIGTNPSQDMSNPWKIKSFP